ncbi:hypothetical protein D3C71_2137430 [compost metagenome]
MDAAASGIYDRNAYAVDGADVGTGRWENSDTKSHFVGCGDAILSGSGCFLSDSHVEGDGQ